MGLMLRMFLRLFPAASCPSCPSRPSRPSCPSRPPALPAPPAPPAAPRIRSPRRRHRLFEQATRRAKGLRRENRRRTRGEGRAVRRQRRPDSLRAAQGSAPARILSDRSRIQRGRRAEAVRRQNHPRDADLHRHGPPDAPRRLAGVHAQGHAAEAHGVRRGRRPGTFLHRVQRPDERHRNVSGGTLLDLPPNGTDIYEVDFNRAYNPYCYYNQSYECPYPPRENRLQIPIRAGEKIKTSH